MNIFIFDFKKIFFKYKRSYLMIISKIISSKIKSINDKFFFDLNLEIKPMNNIFLTSKIILFFLNKLQNIHQYYDYELYLVM